MVGFISFDTAALADSLCHWWALAGVDTPAAEEPRNWLAPKQSVAPSSILTPRIADPVAKHDPVPASVPTVALVPAQTPMPGSLDAFASWLATDQDHPETGSASARVLPKSVPEAPLLIIVDMPAGEDVASGKLFSGDEGALLSTMLRAIGVDESKVAHASLLITRPTGGIIEDAAARRAAVRLVHYIGLLRPQRLLVLGDRTSRALDEMNGKETSTPLLAVNYGSGNIPVMSLPAPFMLLKHPQRKAAAWIELRKLATVRG